MAELEKRATLKDVAAIAGVDASLVSRVVSGDPGISIPDSTRRRILDAVAAANYRPSAMARSLRTRKLATLGLILPDLTNPVYAPIATGAQSRAAEAGFALLLASDTEGPDRTAAFDMVRLLAEDRVDGLLVASGTKNSDLLALLRDLAKPVVLVNRAMQGIPSSTVDDFAGAELATSHLLSRGHSSIAHLGGPRGVDTSQRRLSGFDHAMAAWPGGHRGEAVHARGWGALDGYEAGLELLDSMTSETAVFVANVSLAVGLYRAAHERGRRIPGDISIVAMHDYDLAAMLVPALTTVSMPLYELGRTAVEQLLELVDGGTVDNRVVEGPGILVERQSVLQR